MYLVLQYFWDRGPSVEEHKHPINSMIVFRVSLSFDPMKKNTEIAISDLYFSEKSDYSEENISDNENFRSTILQPFQFEPEQKKFVVMRARRKKLNIHIQLPVYYILE